MQKKKKKNDGCSKIYLIVDKILIYMKSLLVHCLNITFYFFVFIDKHIAYAVET